jgi:hypothetical protein
VAIYHLNAKVISRGKGQSAIAASAYRSGDRLRDEKTGEQKFYPSREERIQFTDIMAPKDTPEWAHDRNRLWNEAEKAEKRKDAQLAREIEISLPHELTGPQREWLVKDFAREAFVRKGYAVDIAIHAPDKESDDRNYHAHLMITMRTLGPNGFAAKKDRDLNSKDQLKAWREQWANLANRHLERHGHKERIDHRSLKEQGVDREATMHVGYAANEIAHRGGQSDRMDELRGILARNEIRTDLKALEKELQALERAQAEELQRRAAEAAKQGAVPAPTPIEVINARHAAAEAERTRLEGVQKLQRADRADQQGAKKWPVGQAFSVGSHTAAQEVRQERREASQAAQQDAWRKDVAAHAPKPGKGREPDTGGLKVFNGVTGVISKLGDVVLDLLAGPSSSPQKPDYEFTTNRAAVKEQQLARLAYAHSLDEDQKARLRMGEDMRAGRNLRIEDVALLTHEHQLQIRARGDDAVRDMVDEARKRSDSHWKGEERERDR